MTRLAPGRAAKLALEADGARVETRIEQFEHTSAGRAVLSGLLIVMFTIQFFWNLPDSELRDAGVGALRPVVLSAGLDQRWGVFAPNPRRVSLDFYAIVEYPDGSTLLWGIPKPDEPFLEPYRTYRWRKWMSWVRLDRNEDDLWEPAARWIMGDMERAGQTPNRVTLVRKSYENPEPGSGDATPQWSESQFFTLEADDDGS